MRIILYCEHVDWNEFADEVEPGEDEQNCEFESIDEARHLWGAMAHDWTNGKTGWFVDSMKVFTDEGDERYLSEFDFPDWDFDEAYEACLTSEE